MRNASLIYNPSSGRNRNLRLRHVEAAAAELRKAGVETTLVPTTAAGSGGRQAAEARAAGHDAVFACGGDGTILDVLQGMVGGNVKVPLGIVPLGTGNVLAHDLGIPNDPAAAIRTQLGFEPWRVAAGKIQYRSKLTGADHCRYFTVMAGVGADAQMIYRVTAERKNRFGVLAYNLEMFRLAFFHKYQPLEVEYQNAETGERHTISAYQVAAVRITEFPGLMRKFAPGAALERDDLRLVLFRSKNRLIHSAYFTGVLLGQNWPLPGVDLVHVKEIICRPQSDDDAIFAQADGEFLGSLPVRITVMPNAFTLLMKPRKR